MGSWTVSRVPAALRGTQPVTFIVRKGLSEWGPCALSAPRLGTGTASSQHAKVPLLHMQIRCKHPFSPPVLEMAKPDLLMQMGPCVAAVTCGAVGQPQGGSVSCSDSPAGEFTYKTSCAFACEEGLRLQGPTQVECTAHGQWTGQAPVCEGKPPGALLHAPLSSRAGPSTLSN